MTERCMRLPGEGSPGRDLERKRLTCLVGSVVNVILLYQPTTFCVLMHDMVLRDTLR